MTGKGRYGATGPVLFILFLAAVAAGCSTAQDPGNFVDAQGNHPANFVSSHPSFAGSSGAACASCHGDGLRGGIANVSCFTASRNGTACHHPSPGSWATPAQHGAAAKRVIGSSSFIVCQICHGSDFAGGGSGLSCLNNASCHGGGINSPHPPRPWRAAGTVDTHTNADPVNAPACGQCHRNGANSTRVPAPPLPPAGTPPGCFNNTLCHGPDVAPHPLGTSWRDPAVGGANFHGTNPAVANAKRNLAFCQTCHGTPGTTSFDGGQAPTKCSDAGCHPAAKAHPTTWYRAPAPFPGYVPSHRDSGNRPGACVICHAATGPGIGPMPGAPSCFSASFSNTEHGLVSCHVNGPGQPNHDVPFDNSAHFLATSGTFASDCANCHAVTGTSPVVGAPLCTVCHAAGSPLTLANCSSCHGNPPNGALPGASYPNIAGGHAKHLALNAAGTPVSCDTCHNGLGTGTSNHYNRANARSGKNALRVSPGDLNFGGAAFLYTSQNGGAASFDNAQTNLTCANVRCHGGTPLSPAPNWQTQTIATLTNAGCRLCHKAATQTPVQYNDVTDSVFPKHVFHAFPNTVSGGDKNFACTACHDTAALTPGRHFGELGSSSLPAGAANATILTSLNWDPTPQIDKGSCTTPTSGCH